jgi:hypothetical protein
MNRQSIRITVSSGTIPAIDRFWRRCSPTLVLANRKNRPFISENDWRHQPITIATAEVEGRITSTSSPIFESLVEFLVYSCLSETRRKNRNRGVKSSQHDHDVNIVSNFVSKKSSQKIHFNVPLRLSSQAHMSAASLTTVYS